jgi:hypothetical protein
MPEEDKAAYGRINNTLGQILHRVLSASQHRAVLDSCLTLGFSPRGGVRGNRPKDLWCAVFAKNAVVYMPQVYLIASLRGIELGFAAGIHPRDFSNATFKSKVKEVVPMIFDLLPQPDDTESQRFEEALRMSGEWHYRRSTRMEPGPGEFSDWSQLLAFLKSPEGKVQGGGAICRYWTPEDLYRVDFVEEFAEALELFTPLVLVGKSVAPAIVQAAPVDDSFQTSELPAPSAEPVSRGIEQFLELYPETRSAQAFGVNQELWGVLVY